MTEQPCWERALTLGLMLVFFGQLCLGSRQLSLTADEPSHLANGYAVVTTGDLWTVPPHGHPPLLNSWSVWPLLLQDERPHAPEVPGWQDSLILFTRNLWGTFGSLDRLALVTRYPNMLLAVLLMALVHRWARSWLSPAAATLAVFLMAWDPTMLAHAQLNTTDLGFTLFAFATFYLCRRLRRSFSYGTLLGVGLAGGAAMGAKASGFLVPLMAGGICWTYGLLGVLQRRAPPSQPPPEGGRRRASGATTVPRRSEPVARWLLSGPAIVMVSIVALWGAYGFRLHPSPLAVHAEMLRIFFEGTERLAFANGRLRMGGWWWYFPFAAAIKTPLPAVAAYLYGTVRALMAPRRRLGGGLALWVFPLAYLASALSGGLNIGYRHLLPLFPFVYVSTGRIAEDLLHLGVRKPYVKRALVGGLGLWYILGTLRVYPFPLAYFNELVGGSERGYRYLVDSNVDWGQSFKALRRYVEENHITDIAISYYTWVDPGAYGTPYRPLFPGQGTEAHMPRRYDPAPGFYAISATTLQGIALKEHDPDLYEWFRHRTPDAQLGYGLLVYNVKPHTPPATWIAQCSVPVTPLGQAAIQEGFGRSDLRHVVFDCTQGWVIPGGGRDTGWYALHRDAWTNASQFAQAQLSSTHLSYSQPLPGIVPAFALFVRGGGTAVPGDGFERTAVAVSTAWASIEEEVTGERHIAPIDLVGPLSFLGYRVVEVPGERAIELWTVWRVREVSSRPLSLIGHLVQPDAHLLGVDDGLSVWIDQWQPDDVIVQRHHFDLPADTPPGRYRLQTGAYWLDTMERMPVQGTAQAADRLLLTSVEIRR